MVTPFIEEEEEVEVGEEEEEIGSARDHLKEKQMEDLEEDSSMEMEEEQREKPIRQLPKVNRGIDRKKIGLY